MDRRGMQYARGNERQDHFLVSCFGSLLASEWRVSCMKKAWRNLVTTVLGIMMVLTITACGARNAGTETSAPQPEPDESAEAGSAAGKRVYFAAPLFSQGEKDYNLRLTKVLEDHGYEVFLPQRDGFLAAELEGKTEEEATQMIFEKDCSEVLKADIVFMLLDGRIPDEGACVELGLAYANGKRCYGFKTDARSVEINMDMNPMITGCLTKLFRNNDGEALIQELEQYLSEHEL